METKYYTNLGQASKLVKRYCFFRSFVRSFFLLHIKIKNEKVSHKFHVMCHIKRKKEMLLVDVFHFVCVFIYFKRFFFHSFIRSFVHSFSVNEKETATVAL